jgi:hypothetical protein
MEKRITIDGIIALKPCDDYPPKRVRELAGGARDASALEILTRKDIPAMDRLWLALREKLIDAPVLHEFACRCAERALARIDSPDPRGVAAIEAKRRWLRGEATDEELQAARAAARGAAWGAWGAERATAWCEQDAAWSAERAAERAAAWCAWDAERAAAQDAAWGAAQSAERAAAWCAAQDAEREWQVAELRGMLEANL